MQNRRLAGSRVIGQISEGEHSVAVGCGTQFYRHLIVIVRTLMELVSPPSVTEFTNQALPANPRSRITGLLWLQDNMVLLTRVILLGLCEGIPLES